MNGIRLSCGSPHHRDSKDQVKDITIQSKVQQWGEWKGEIS